MKTTHSEVRRAIFQLLDKSTGATPGTVLDTILWLRDQEVTPPDVAHALANTPGQTTRDQGSLPLGSTSTGAGDNLTAPAGDYDDDTICWFGKYKRQRFGAIDISYWRWLYEQRPLKNDPEGKLITYIMDRLGIETPADNEDEDVPF